MARKTSMHGQNDGIAMKGCNFGCAAILGLAALVVLALVIGIVFPAIGGSGGSGSRQAPSGPTPREQAYEQQRQDFIAELTPERVAELETVIREMQASGLVQKIEDGAMFVDPVMWSIMDLDLKRGAAHTAWLFAYQSDPRVTRILRIVDRRSGDRIAKYTASQGLH